ncbi:hypothetical protein QY049_28870 [Bradyrhizobium sp. WYCCWR 13022]|uniref:hypothetical protein n=1 Tax=unclassified Bradyrhizobium TaxID=2631580 RepID=UPI00263B6591|nr:hypothetical protein [Bradyrhizobium sp. WYCCWR 13022]MDN4987179.1 hypothetical protein [Bradyrhizobium sp. WYCCWR 13022]
MNKTQTYTLYFPENHIDKDDTVVARRLSATEAMKVVFSHGSGWTTCLQENGYDAFTHYVLAAWPNRRPPEHTFNERLHATVIRSGDAEKDEAAAMEMIAAQCIRFNHLYWGGRVESDEAFDKRLSRVAKAREVRRIDGEITTKLVDALLADGYTITCDLLEDEPEFQRSTDRDGILAYLRQVETAQLDVHKGKDRRWINLIFDEAGWDVVADYSVDLERIIEPICEPYLPWNQPDADIRDHGIRVIALNSPDDVLKIEKMLK